MAATQAPPSGTGAGCDPHRLPGWWPTGKDTVLYNPATVSTTRYRYRAARIETPWQAGWVASREPTAGLERLQGLITR
jgi:hypothetical protein